MEEKKRIMYKEIKNLIPDQTTIYLSTIDGSIPRVRPVTMIKNDSRYFILTGSNDAKIRQIKKNNQVEICFPLHKEKSIGYFRTDGRVDIVMDKELKRVIAEKADYFEEYWTSLDDPNYALLELNMNNIEILKPGETITKKYKFRE